MSSAMRPDSSELDRGPLLRTPQEDWEFKGAHDLLRWVRDLTEELADRGEWKAGPGSLENLFLGTFARGTKTYGAALLLCDRGYGEQAGMLNRSLFEHMVVAWWISLQPDGEGLMATMRRHYEHAQVLFGRALEHHPELDVDGGDDRPGFPDDYVDELDREFGRYGGQWHGKRLDELVREVEDGWDEPYPGLLWKFFRIVNHWNNYVLHHSAVGVVQGMQWRSLEEEPELRLGPSSEWRVASLWAAFWCYGLLVLCVLRQLSPDRADGFRAYFEERANRFMPVTPEMAKNVGRNAACPCGSGMKFKSCHGAYM